MIGFDIVREPLYTDIHNVSFHPTQQKMEEFYGIVNKLTNVPLSKQNYEKKLNTVKQIAVNNDF